MNFRVLGDDEYRGTIPDHEIEFHAARLRLERYEVHGELTVTCGLAGAKVFDDATLSSSTMNFSSSAARIARAKALAERARTGNQIDWIGHVEEFSTLVLRAMRSGAPAVMLSRVKPEAAEPIVMIEGYPVFLNQHAIDFGDGGTGKSLWALYRGGKLEAAGERVALFDWELDADTHHRRLKALVGADRMPSMRYVRCDRPLVHELDRLRRIVLDEEITFGIFDSVGFACDGPPEAAESALAYFRATRQLRIGGIHLAHVSKADTGDQRPFGSAFWSNSARSTWYVKAAENSPNSLTIGAINRKANLGPQRPALAYTFTFSPEEIKVKRVDAAALDALVGELKMWERIRETLKTGPRTLAALAEALGAKVDSVDKAVKRKTKIFTRVNGPDGIVRIALLEGRAA